MHINIIINLKFCALLICCCLNTSAVEGLTWILPVVEREFEFLSTYTKEGPVHSVKCHKTNWLLNIYILL